MLVRRGHWGRDWPLLTRIPRLVIAAALMGGILYFGIRWLEPQLASASPLYTQATTLAVLCAGGAVIYFMVAFGIAAALILSMTAAEHAGEQTNADPRTKRKLT